MPDLTQVNEAQTVPEEVRPEPSRPTPPPSRKKPAGKGRKKLIKRLIALGVAAAVLGGGGFALYRFLNSSDESLGEIYALPASIGTIQSTVSGQGSAKAKETAAITLTQSGVVQEVFVTSGQTVMAGEPLYTIYSQAAEDAVKAAKDNVTEAQKRVTEAERGVVTAQRAVPAAQEALEKLQKELAKMKNEETAKLNEELAKLKRELADLEGDRADLTVRAPRAGKIVKHESFTVGKDASPGPVCTVADNQTMKLSLYYSYAYEDSIYTGQTAQVSIPSLMKVQEGRVEEIRKVNFISPEGGTFFEVVVSLSNPGALTKGMTATATMAGGDGSEIYPYADGKLDYAETWDLELKIGGPVLSVDLSDHSLVTAGQALLTVGDDQIKDKIEAKQNEIKAKQEAIEAFQETIKDKEKEIKRQIDEVIPDAKEGIKTAQEGVEAAKQAVADAQQKVEEEEKKLADFNAVAPIDGTVTSCTIEPGQEVKSGDTVVMISNTVSMVVTISVTDQNISFIKPGDTVELTSYNDGVFIGTVTAIDVSKAESGQGMTTYPVTLTVDNFDGTLMEGMGLRYSFVTSQSDDCVMVPTAAIQYFSDAEGNRCTVVFVQRDARPDDVPELELPTFEPGQKRTFPTEEEGYYPVIVETGLADAQNVEIKSGVEAGDNVFVNYTVTDYAGW